MLTINCMYLLLPPSERKLEIGTNAWDTSEGRFEISEQRNVVLDAVSSDILRLAKHAEQISIPAHKRYLGVVWKAIDPGRMDAESLLRASERVLVVSALGGLFTWNEPVPFYKLKMGSSTPITGKLSKYWSKHLPQKINDRPVIDLLALEQSAAVPVPYKNNGWLRIELLGVKGERSGHNGKAAKGRLARALILAEDPFETLERYKDSEGWVLRIEKR